jgi:hypothetical protein
MEHVNVYNIKHVLHLRKTQVTMSKLLDIKF